MHFWISFRLQAFNSILDTQSWNALNVWSVDHMNGYIPDAYFTYTGHTQDTPHKLSSNARYVNQIEMKVFLGFYTLHDLLTYYMSF